MLINEGDNCIISYSVRHDEVYKMMTIKRGKEVKINKHTFKWDKCIGQPYGLTWGIEKKQLSIEGGYKIESTVEKLLQEKDSALDNRNQYDRNKDAEQMAKVRNDVEELRAKDASQDAILATVIEQNQNFEAKNRHTQEKYVRMKQKRHGGRIQILAPNERNIMRQLLSRDQSASSMDIQAMSMCMSLANVHANANIMVVEHGTGTLLGGIMARQVGGKGKCVAIFNGQLGDTPTLHGVQPYQFEDPSWHRMSYYPARCLGQAAIEGVFENQVYEAKLPIEVTKLKEEEETAAPLAKKAKLTPEEIENKRIERKLKRIAKYEQSIELLKKGMDGLIISVKQHPLPWVLMLRKFMKPGRPFSVFCERQEPLVECYGSLMDSQAVCNLQISTVFERTIQVLPERTHPNVMMPGNRGFILSGITVTE